MTATEVISKRVRELRERRGGMSAQALADRCAELGMPGLKRQAITNLENGRRGIVTVDELLVLAQALDVPPVSLFLPDGAIAITPTVEMDAMRLLLWVSGEQPPPDDIRRDPERLRKWLQVASPLESLRKLHLFMSQVQILEGVVSAQPERKAKLDEAVENMATCVSHLVNNGVTPPALPARLVELMTERGLLSYPDAVPTAEA